jgi:TRAP-type mannitol/chloroaromatic compound transport system substrate-binding protein
VLEGLVNKAAYQGLPADLRQIVDTACKAATLDMLSEFSARNGDALASLKEHQVDIRPFPDDVLAELQRITPGVLEEIAAEDEMSARVYASFKAYFAKVRQWTNISEKVMLSRL